VALIKAGGFDRSEKDGKHLHRRISCQRARSTL
jgi:hypothetical protein